jgi:hypothetical protein
MAAGNTVVSRTQSRVVALGDEHAVQPLRRVSGVLAVLAMEREPIDPRL